MCLFNILCLFFRATLNALIQLKLFIGHKKRDVLVNNFIYSSINYCPLVWMLSHKKSLNKIESLHKRALGFSLNDYITSYQQLLKLKKCNMNVHQL